MWTSGSRIVACAHCHFSRSTDFYRDVEKSEKIKWNEHYIERETTRNEEDEEDDAKKNERNEKVMPIFTCFLMMFSGLLWSSAIISVPAFICKCYDYDSTFFHSSDLFFFHFLLSFSCFSFFCASFIFRDRSHRYNVIGWPFTKTLSLLPTEIKTNRLCIFFNMNEYKRKEKGKLGVDFPFSTHFNSGIVTQPMKNDEVATIIKSE